MGRPGAETGVGGLAFHRSTVTVEMGVSRLVFLCNACKNHSTTGGTGKHGGSWGILDKVVVQHHYLPMYLTQLSAPQKAGVILYGLLIGTGATVATAAAGCILGFLAGFFVSLLRIDLGEGQPWLPIVGLFGGFYVGIVVGVIGCWKVCRSRLRRVPTQ
jgi:hypothetical protein